MSYLPGVPNVGPQAVTPTVKAPRAKTSIGKPQGIAAVAHGVGKPGRTQQLGSVVGRNTKGISSITGGNPVNHSGNHYGKTPPAFASSQTTGGVDPTAHSGATMIRGGTGQMSHHIRQGGLGPGKQSTPGPSNTDYSMKSGDTE